MSKKDGTYTVYTHTSPSGKVYVGISKNLQDRWMCKGSRYLSYESIFKHAIQKYGWDNLKHEILLEGITKSEAVYAEKYLIRWYKLHGLSYNITDGGEGTLGMKFSQERIQKARDTKVSNWKYVYLTIDKDFNYNVFNTIAEAADSIGAQRVNFSHVLDQPIGYTCKGYYVWRQEKGSDIDIDFIREQILTAREERHLKASEATKARSSQLTAASRAATAKMTPEEKKLKFGRSEAHIGTHHSEETKRKMSASAKGRDMSTAIAASVEARRKKATPIIVSKDGVFVGEYKVAIDACRDLNISSQNMSRALKHGYKVGGYKLTYKTLEYAD